CRQREHQSILLPMRYWRNYFAPTKIRFSTWAMYTVQHQSCHFGSSILIAALMVLARPTTWVFSARPAPVNLFSLKRFLLRMRDTQKWHCWLLILRGSFLRT